MTIDIKIPNADQFSKLLAEAPQIVAGELRRALEKGSDIILGNAVKRTPSGATNHLRDSIAKDVRPFEASIFSTLTYAPKVEFGSGARGDGQIPAVPVAGKELLDWARRKLGNEGLAYPIAKVISQQGTYAHPYLNPAAEDEKDRVIGFFEDALQNIVSKLAI